MDEHPRIVPQLQPQFRNALRRGDAARRIDATHTSVLFALGCFELLNQ
jgi:hypothetical protein